MSNARFRYTFVAQRNEPCTHTFTAVSRDDAWEQLCKELLAESVFLYDDEREVSSVKLVSIEILEEK